jgi:serine/threonine-protein kinase
MAIEHLGPYRIVGELGRGGMGTVLEAVNRDTGDVAALKLLATPLASEEGFRDRFAAEIETLRKLNHPNIVRLLGYGEQDGRLFYAMELVDGSSLEDELSRGRRFEWRETTHIAIEVCHALRHAHDRGVVHRDLKPGNLLLTPDGHVKLTDFGIARLFGNTRKTLAGSILGTAEFMAPEQAEGKPVDARSDLYSLGGVMWVLLARRPLFTARSLLEMLDKQRFEKPEPLRRYAPECPDELERIVMQLLEKSPEKRMPNALLLGRRLLAMQRALSVVAETLVAPPVEIVDKASAGAPATARPEMPSTDVIASADAVPSAAEAGDEPMPDTKATNMADRMAVERPGRMLERGLARPPGRFVAVEESDLDPIPADDSDEPRVWMSMWTIALVAALVAVGLTLWYALQPPSADALFDRIRARDSGSGAPLEAAEADIESFLMRFPRDSRATTMREYQREIELARLERQFDRRAKGFHTTENLLPVERAYVEAINHARLDNDAGIVKLQALIDLFGQRHEDAGPQGLCLELARRRLEQLRLEQDRALIDLLASVDERLNEAERYRESQPQRAATIYRALIELYGQKTWAASAVARARRALNELEPAP